MNPSGALGAVSAIHDAVTLANWISTLRLASPKEVEDIFKEYRAERYPVAKANFETSRLFIRNMGKVVDTHENRSRTAKYSCYINVDVYF